MSKEDLIELFGHLIRKSNAVDSYNLLDKLSLDGYIYDFTWDDENTF